MSRVKEYLVLIPIVGTKYVYQRGVNGSFKFSLENSKLSQPSSGNERKPNYSDRKLSTEWKLNMHRNKSHDGKHVEWKHG